jgi:hypothetical protein
MTLAHRLRALPAPARRANAGSPPGRGIARVPGMLPRPTSPPTRTPESARKSRPLRPTRPMSRSLPRSSPMSRARFMLVAPTTPCRSKRPSKRRAEPRGFCARAIGGFPPQTWKRGPLRPIRAWIKKIFGTWKRNYSFRHMRWLGLAKAKPQVHLAAIAYNVKRYWRRQTA